MTQQLLDDNEYYEVELLPMGIHRTEGHLTASDEEWGDEGQTRWNVWCTLRNDEECTVEEVFDIDLPVTLESEADALFGSVEERVTEANETRIPIMT